MTDYGYVFSKTLHQKLKEKIYAGVHVKSTDDDKLEIIIARDSEGLLFKMEVDNFSDRLLHGYSTDYAVYEVLTRYRKFILNRYFVKESGAH